LLRELLESALPESRRTGLEAHVDTCVGCQKRLEALCQEESLPDLQVDRVGSPLDAETTDWIEQVQRKIPPPGFWIGPGAGTKPPGSSDGEETFTIPGFEHLELIGRGGSGTVYRAWQPELKRWVALKTFPALQGGERTARVLREARILGRLQHPHVVRIHGLGELQGQPYLVMEWITGGSLHERIRQGPLPIREATHIALQVATALEAVHALGIVHRDLKPANILLESPSGETQAERIGNPDPCPTARLTDFSVAFEEDPGGPLSRTGMVIGTPDYMAPEQTGLDMPSGIVGPPADIYGLGAVLYACLTRQPPHRGESALATLQLVATREPAPLRSLRREIPPDLATIAQKCLRSKPADRYRSAGELADDLRNFLAGRPIAARPYSLAERAWHWARRRPGQALAVGMLLGLALLAGAGGLYHLRQMEHVVQQLERRTTEAERATAALQSSLLETRHTQWGVVQQLSLKAAALLRTGHMERAEQQWLIETTRRHFQSRVRELDRSEEEHAVARVTALDRWCQLEEQHGFVSEALADGQWLDQVMMRFPTLTELQPLVRSRDLRRVRLLGRLQQWDEATRQLDLLLDQEPRVTGGAEVVALAATVRQHARSLAEAGNTATARRLVDRALTRCVGLSDPSPHEPALAGEWLELRWLGIELRMPTGSPTGESPEEAEWLKTVRGLLAETRTNDPAKHLVLVHLVQRLVPLTARRSPQMAAELLGLWGQEIDRLSTTAGQDERVVQWLDWADHRGRLASQTSDGSASPVLDWEGARDGALHFLAQHPDDLPTRQRVSALLIRRSQHQLTHDPAAALAEARRAIELLTPLAGRAELAAGSTTQWIEAHRGVAAASRALGRLGEARAALEQVYALADRDSRDAVAVELVALSLSMGDRGRAEQAAGWILDDGPARTEANRLLQADGSAAFEPR
jgi:hypothetical protein